MYSNFQPRTPPRLRYSSPALSGTLSPGTLQESSQPQFSPAGYGMPNQYSQQYSTGHEPHVLGTPQRQTGVGFNLMRSQSNIESQQSGGSAPSSQQPGSAPSSQQPTYLEIDFQPHTTVKLKVPAGWQDQDLQTLVDLWTKHAVRGDKPPSEVPEVVSTVEDILKKSSQLRRAVHEEEIPADIKPKLDAAQLLTRRFLCRYYCLSDVYPAILETCFGSDFEDKQPKMYQVCKDRILGNGYTWKSRAIKEFVNHVAILMEEDPLLSSASDVSALRTYFKQKFSLENVPTLLSWTARSIDWKNCSAAAKNLTFDAYVRMCVEVKLHLDSPRAEGFDSECLREFWDKLGETSLDVTPDDFRTVNIKRSAKDTSRSARKKKTRLEEHPRFVATDATEYPFQEHPPSPTPIRRSG